MGPSADFGSMRCIEKTSLQLKSKTRWSNFCREEQVALTPEGFQEKILFIKKGVRTAQSP